MWFYFCSMLWCRLCHVCASVCVCSLIFNDVQVTERPPVHLASDMVSLYQHLMSFLVFAPRNLGTSILIAQHNSYNESNAFNTWLVGIGCDFSPLCERNLYTCTCKMCNSGLTNEYLYEQFDWSNSYR